MNILVAMLDPHLAIHLTATRTQKYHKRSFSDQWITL